MLCSPITTPEATIHSPPGIQHKTTSSQYQPSNDQIRTNDSAAIIVDSLSRTRH